MKYSNPNANKGCSHFEKRWFPGWHSNDLTSFSEETECAAVVRPQIFLSPYIFEGKREEGGGRGTEREGERGIGCNKRARLEPAYALSQGARVWRSV